MTESNCKETYRSKLWKNLLIYYALFLRGKPCLTVAHIYTSHNQNWIAATGASSSSQRAFYPEGPLKKAIFKIIIPRLQLETRLPLTRLIFHTSSNGWILSEFSQITECYLDGAAIILFAKTETHIIYSNQVSWTWVCTIWAIKLEDVDCLAKRPSEKDERLSQFAGKRLHITSKRCYLYWPVYKPAFCRGEVYKWLITLFDFNEDQNEGK